MINGIKIFSFLLWFMAIFSFSAVSYGLVDYGGGGGDGMESPSDEGGIKMRLKEKLETGGAKQNSQKNIKKFSRGESGGKITERAFDFGFNYESLSIKQQNVEGTVSILRFMGSIQTPINIFLDFSYYGAKTESQQISEDSSLQRGNPKLILGFNWLKIGKIVLRLISMGVCRYLKKNRH